jgi:hypothetical protein
MTGRERINAVLRKQPKDRLPWATLVDDPTLSLVPEEHRGNGGIDFYKHLGCDIFLLNGWNTPYNFMSPEHRWPEEVEVIEKRVGEKTTITWKTPKGVLTGIFVATHPVKYPVDSLSALHIFREMWEGSSFIPHDDSGTFTRLDNVIGEYGAATRYWGPSTVSRLLQLDMGVENFYYLLADHRDEMHGLIHAMHQKEIDAFNILADGPWDSVTLSENTSTYNISPDVYYKYNMPHQREFVDTVKSRGKIAILHMCGHVRGILEMIKETGCDGIHTLTPPPTGNTPWEDALDVLGDDLIIFGCLDPTIFVTGEISQISSALDTLITPRLREANFVLNPMADGIAVDPARFYAIAQWVEKNLKGS